MSSLIFLPFLASSGLPAAPSPPPSAGFVGRVSFLFCSAMLPSIGARTVFRRVSKGATCQHSSIPGAAGNHSEPAFGRGSAPAELLAEAEGLVLVGRTQPGPVQLLGRGPQALEPDLERCLAVVHHERYLARADLHHHLGAQHRTVPPAEPRVEEPRVVGPDLPRPGVVDDHFGGKRWRYADPLLGHEDIKAVGLQDVAVSRRLLDRLPELDRIVVTNPA